MALETRNSSAAMLALNGVSNADAEDVFSPEYLAKVEQWRERAPGLAPQPELLHDDSVRLFYLSVDGEASDYFPDKASNDIGESLFREFAERKGELEDVSNEPQCKRIQFKAAGESESIHQLLCPTFSSSDTLQGFLIVQPRGTAHTLR